jgi:hypothetical protein
MYFFQHESLVRLTCADGVTSLSFIASIAYFLRSANYAYHIICFVKKWNA